MNLENQTPFFWICIGILVIIMLREITCWYWKINEILNEKKKQTRILEEMLFTMNPNATYFDEQENKESTP